jgi:hypothetical protein
VKAGAGGFYLRHRPSTPREHGVSMKPLREKEFPVLSKELPVPRKKFPVSAHLREFDCNILKLPTNSWFPRKLREFADNALN